MSEFLDNHHQFGQTEARPAVGFVDVQPEPAQLGQFPPERRAELLIGVQSGPSRRPGFLPGQERAGDRTEFAVIVGQGDGHSASST